jgi:hypothetical protein
MQHEGDEMKVASYPQSSRLLVAKGSRGNSFSMRGQNASNQQVSLGSRSGEVISLGLLGVFMEASDIQRS